MHKAMTVSPLCSPHTNGSPMVFVCLTVIVLCADLALRRLARLITEVRKPAGKVGMTQCDGLGFQFCDIF
eukprot:16429414-Heterocapsa_arctica.AAC.1